MSTLRAVWRDERSKALKISALLSAVLLLLTAACTSQIGAWFKHTLFIENPAQLTNFVTQVSYSYNGTDWTTVRAGGYIPVTPDTIDDLQIKIGYRGDSSAYLRASLFGSFKNADTGTFLPQTEEFWQWDIGSSAESEWIVREGDQHVYYASRLSDCSSFVALEGVLGVSTDTAVYENASQYQDYAGELYVIVDAVQPDRYPEFWGIDTFPFE